MSVTLFVEFWKTKHESEEGKMALPLLSYRTAVKSEPYKKDKKVQSKVQK
jgi:hypothetical protein